MGGSNHDDDVRECHGLSVKVMQIVFSLRMTSRIRSTSAWLWPSATSGSRASWGRSRRTWLTRGTRPARRPWIASTRRMSDRGATSTRPCERSERATPSAESTSSKTCKRRRRRRRRLQREDEDIGPVVKSGKTWTKLSQKVFSPNKSEIVVCSDQSWSKSIWSGQGPAGDWWRRPAVFDDEKNLDKVSKCLKKNLIASAWFCRCRLYSRVASSRPKCLVLWSFFSSRICSVPSFRVSSLPKPGFIVIPHSLVANRRNKTWKLFFSTHTNKKYSSLQTNFPPKTRIKLLKKT